MRLTFSEFELLDALMADPGRLLNRQELLRAIWGDSAYRDPRAIDVHIRHLREKLEPEAEKPRYIQTLRELRDYFDVDASCTATIHDRSTSARPCTTRRPTQPTSIAPTAVLRPSAWWSPAGCLTT